MWNNEWIKGTDYPEWGETEVYKKTISGGYLLNGETPRDAYNRVCTTVARRLDRPELAETFFKYIWKGWLCLASPVLSNTGTDRGLPISGVGSDVADSIKDIGKPWDKKIVNLHGDTISLNQLEHEVIRKNYKEPRIHFALVCAAKGCPVLISDAYTGDTLESQLENSTKAFLSAPDKNKIDDANQVIVVSPIFDWFADAFSAKSGSVVAFIAPYYSKNPEDLKS